MYGEVKALIPYDASKTLGNYVRLTNYVDARIFHDKLTGSYVTGILHLVNKTPVDWYYNKQSTVETSTYGYEIFLPVHVWKISLIRGILFDTLVCPSARKSTCFEITNLFLTVPSTHILSYISAPLLYTLLSLGGYCI